MLLAPGCFGFYKLFHFLWQIAELFAYIFLRFLEFLSNVYFVFSVLRDQTLWLAVLPYFVHDWVSENSGFLLTYSSVCILEI